MNSNATNSADNWTQSDCCEEEEPSVSVHSDNTALTFDCFSKTFIALSVSIITLKKGGCYFSIDFCLAVVPVSDLFEQGEMQVYEQDVFPGIDT